jgi:hypothetical protein
MTNEQAIEAFLQSNKEVKANNITTHYNENDGENLLRQYGTVIATRKGNKVTFTGKKYSKTTTKLTNDIKYLANKYGFVIEKSKKFAKGSNVVEYRRGGVMGDVYSIQNKEQFKQLITTYNELSEKFGVLNYFLDHNDNSVVFLMHGDEESMYDTIKLQRYIDSLYSRGFDVFDKTKNKNIIITKDNSQGGGYVYFKLKLSKIVQYDKGGNADSENAEMVLNENKQIKHHTEELPNAIKGKHVPAWVVAKVNRSASDLSDATHYLDGAKYGKGGNTENGKTWLDGIEYLFC